MKKKPDFICSFNQKLSYNDFLNFNNYIIKNKEKNTIKKSFNKNILELIIKSIILFFFLFLVFVGLKADGTLQNIILVLLILFVIFLLLLKNPSVVVAKVSSLKSTEKKFTLFKDYIFYEPINEAKYLEKYKFLTKDISEIILTSEFCAIKFISKTILINLSNNSPEILTMIIYLKNNYSNKIITT